MNFIPPDVDLGANRKDIGTHSNRKGASSYCLLWPVISAVQVYLRAGWSLGNVQDRYIIAGAGADQLVGRAVSGLPINSNEFSALPPHFIGDALTRLAEIGWDNLLPGYTTYPGCLQRTVPFLLASLAYHLDWLHEKLSPQHPLWNHPIFTQLPPLTAGYVSLGHSLKQFVVCGLSRCPHTNMVATGIPYHLAIAMEVHQNTREIAVLKEVQAAMKTEIINVINQKTTEVLNATNSLPTVVKDAIMDNFQVNGVVPLRPDDVLRIAEGLENRITQQVTNLMNELRQRVAAVPAQEEKESEEEKVDLVHQVFHWGGAMRCVPMNFNFPSTTTKAMWTLWYHGNRNLRIGPYRQLAYGHQNDLQSRNERMLLSKTKSVMEALEHICYRTNRIRERRAHDIMNLSQSDSLRLFDDAFRELLRELYGDKPPSRPLDIICATIANRISKKRQRDQRALDGHESSSEDEHEEVW